MPDRMKSNIEKFLKKKLEKLKDEQDTAYWKGQRNIYEKALEKNSVEEIKQFVENEKLANKDCRYEPSCKEALMLVEGEKVALDDLEENIKIDSKNDVFEVAG